ncbi:MAG: serine/threonine protein phosphatase PrpC [Myxococcota bacterium]|jgi:serine/threonine protein phosphatase PrpC
MEHPRLDWGAASATGPIRHINEDRCRAVPIPGWGGIFAVFDGMGGMVAASMHADLALETLVHHLRSTPDSDRFTEAALRGAIQAAHEAVQHHNVTHNTPGSGGTLAVAMVHGYQMWIAWVGDCRIWKQSGDTLTALTQEHLLINALIAQGKLTPEEAKSSPYSNIVLRALGSGDALCQPDVGLFPLSPGDRLLLATDGMWRVLSDEVVSTRLARGGAQEIAERLLTEVHATDGRDNATVIVVTIR